MNNGYDVIVLEAQERPGGRVETIREPFKNRGYAEAGALRIFNSHHWTLKYIKLMGLESKLAAYNDDRGRPSLVSPRQTINRPQGSVASGRPESEGEGRSFRADSDLLGAWIQRRWRSDSFRLSHRVCADT